MKYIDRHDTYSIKFDDVKPRYGREDLIPLWVADMDFKTPYCIRKALINVVNQGVFGYNTIPKEYFPIIREWLSKIQKWDVEEEWLTFIPGIVKGIGYVINYFTKPSDKIIVQPPIYPPFMSVPSGNDRELLFNPLIKTSSGNYEMNFNNLEKIASNNNCKLLILSNPHNPAGILWSRESLCQLAEICHKYNILVISDEIHADMPLWGAQHIPFATVSKEAAEISITFGAPSKTFNMAGIVSSFAVIPNDKIRNYFYKWLHTNELCSPTIFSTVGTIAAYKEGNEWRKDMLKYIESNILLIEKWCRKIKFIKPLRPDASFLVWIDCNDLIDYLINNDESLVKKFDGNRQKILVDFFVNKTRLALNDGATFGPGGEGYMRYNAGTGRNIINESMSRIYNALYNSNL